MSKSLALFVAFALLIFTAPAAADPFASAWSQGQKSAVRLAASGDMTGAAPGAANAEIRAGIEIALNPGAHTYWRAPGEAGVPPSASFEGSENLAKAELLFPAPRRLVEDGVTVFGYEDGVIFPVAVTPLDASKPVTLKLKLDYAACERICVPERASLSLTLPPASAPVPRNRAVAAALARVPRPQTEGPADALRVERVTYARSVNAVGKPVFAIEALAPEGAKSIELFPIAPDGWFLQIGPAQRQDAAHARFDVSVEDMPKDAQEGRADVSFVLVADERAVEFKTSLDAGQLKP